MRPFRRRAGVILTLLAVATLVSLGPPAPIDVAEAEAELPASPASPARPSGPAATHGVDRMVQHYNICGAACAAPVPTNATGLAAFGFNADNALTISLNEVCRFQYEQLVSATSPTGSVFVTTRANVPNCPGTDKSFGNALLVRFAPGTIEYHRQTLSNPGRDCANPSTECRGMACASGLSAPTSGVEVGACTSHFIHNDDTIAQHQAGEFAFIGVSVTPEQRWLAGDFNLEPGQFPVVYAGATTIGCPSTYCPTIPSVAPTNMIDYIFAPPSPLHGPLDPVCISWASDHCFLHGRIGWQLD